MQGASDHQEDERRQKRYGVRNDKQHAHKSVRRLVNREKHYLLRRGLYHGWLVLQQDVAVGKYVDSHC